MPVVLDISSDEEEGLMEEPKISDFDWIKDLLFTSDEESDDEGDPENGVTSVDEEATGSDELLVVGEKGQMWRLILLLACRLHVETILMPGIFVLNFLSLPPPMRGTAARYRPRSVPRQLLGVRSHAIQRERGSGASSLGPQFLHPHMMSKGVGSAGGIQTMNRSSNGSPGFNNCVNATRQCDKFHTATGFSNFRNHNGPDDVCHPINSSFFSHSSSGPASLSCVNQQTVTSETHAYGHSLSQSNDSQDFHQTSIQGNDAPSSYVACLDSNQHQVRSQNNNADGNVTQSGVTSQDTCQPKPHEESPSGTAGKFSVFDSSWAENTSQGIEPAIECSPLQSPGTINQPPNIEKSGTQFTGSTEPVIECSQSPSSLLDIENWLFDKDSIPMVTDGVLSRELNIPSPDLTPVDSGMLLFYLNGGE
ncbi:hypothetical protein SESBI_31534 [Sesbania bispinosa]|nr:hypothetical protein SESBI_31534 [Sesbania bispinosa]